MYTTDINGDRFIFAMKLIAMYNTLLLYIVLMSDEMIIKCLSFSYIFQCAFRSIFVSNYVTQTTTTTHWLNAPLLARLLAFVGETCFIIQLALYFNKHYESVFLFSYIIISNLYAQIASTVGTVTKFMGHFITEGFLWLQIFATLVVWSIIIFVSDNGSDTFFVKAAVVCLHLCVYMGLVYIPYILDCANAPPIIVTGTVIEKIKKAFLSKNVSVEWDVWQDEAMWQMPYFIIGPAVSASLCFM
ncbi:hypothetical protein EhV006 [Emiliania huxleyi virus 86]|uniref:Putative membrane protein n=1 Tax=Emiliania huxleyi virus 86 (isolate United Kingdom/English Channel/1999) TaxID=654925 RepID=Q4A3C8_EHV8U|nr:hypothetical protein EhV006 [Emiliania huxleyi virus 86]AEO97817.1 hypothetical protein ENVG_00119 [Emiliania huxleyi virus 84]AEP14942.1 hypothetical protein EOVG_00005 [Emiliania huxleyi virus 88]AHA54560.1 putative membrane protein [Emiliania huxleyi virus 145]AHA55601.1 putative membrane protein [Emiliania huxleyi virus 164]CAI65429.1 putative membrane protein [Emiliania huxleyi virus 86]